MGLGMPTCHRFHKTTKTSRSEQLMLHVMKIYRLNWENQFKRGRKMAGILKKVKGVCRFEKQCSYIKFRSDLNEWILTIYICKDQINLYDTILRSEYVSGHFYSLGFPGYDFWVILSVIIFVDVFS